MRKYEVKERTVKKKELAELSCDFCRKKQGDPCEEWWEDNWEEGHHLMEETCLEIKTKTTIRRKDSNTDQYSESGEVTTRSVDICPGCWNKHLEPWLEKLGVKPHVRRSIW